MGLMSGLHAAFRPSEPAPNLPQPLNLLAEEEAKRRQQNSSASACPLPSSLRADLPRKPFITATSLGEACFQKKEKKNGISTISPSLPLEKFLALPGAVVAEEPISCVFAPKAVPLGGAGLATCAVCR